MSEQTVPAPPSESDTILATQNAAMAPNLVATQGTGKAYQSVAQSMAIAVQDATDNLRNASTIANTAMGVALAQFLATNDERYFTAIVEANKIITNSAAALASVGQTAVTVMKEFPAST